MSAKTENKWINLSFIVLIFLVGWIVGNLFDLIVVPLKLRNPMIGVLPATRIAGYVLAAVAGFFYLRRPSVRSYCFEVVGEVKKVVWPTRPTVVQATIAVVLLSVFSAVLLGVYDWVCNRLVGFVLQV